MVYKNDPDQMQYAKVTEVLGRWKADIIENYLKSEDINVVLIQEATSPSTHNTSAFATVQIFVPKTSIQRARELLKLFNETQDNPKENFHMANKKKIEERNKASQTKQAERTIQMIAIGVVVAIVLALGYMAYINRTPTIADTVGVPTVRSLQYDAYPPMAIDPSKEYLATFKMAKGGEFVIKLFPDIAPKTVNNFVFLAREGFYDGVTFHRVIKGFMAQGGDPTGTGTGGPGYQFEDEFDGFTFDRAGLLAMANTGPNSNGSQFFITYDATPHLNNLHTIFGEVIEGMDVVNSLTPRDPNLVPDYSGDVIETITITEN